jgi:hypothetical protein
MPISLDLGVQNLGFSRLVPSGRGESVLKEMLSTEAVSKLYKKIFSYRLNGLKIVIGDNVEADLAE